MAAVDRAPTAICSKPRTFATFVLTCLVAVTVTAPLLTVAAISVTPSASDRKNALADLWASSDVGEPFAMCNAAASVLDCSCVRDDAAPLLVHGDSGHPKDRDESQREARRDRAGAISKLYKRGHRRSSPATDLRVSHQKL